MKHQVFISHSMNSDGALAGRIRDDLTARGFACWLAPGDVRPGKNYDVEITQAIDASSAVVVVLSRVAAASDHVATELNLVKARGGIPVFPFLIEDVRGVPGIEYLLGRRHAIEAFRYQPHAARRYLVDCVEAELRSKSKPSPPDPIEAAGGEHGQEPARDERGAGGESARRKPAWRPRPALALIVLAASTAMAIHLTRDSSPDAVHGPAADASSTESTTPSAEPPRILDESFLCQVPSGPLLDVYFDRDQRTCRIVAGGRSWYPPFDLREDGTLSLTPDVELAALLGSGISDGALSGAVRVDPARTGFRWDCAPVPLTFVRKP